MFYDTLEKICKEKKTSPCAVCIALGISKSNVTAWKKGRSPKLETVLAIADVLKVNPTKLIHKS